MTNKHIKLKGKRDSRFGNEDDDAVDRHISDTLSEEKYSKLLVIDKGVYGR